MEPCKIKFVLKITKEFNSLSPGLTFESYQVSKDLFDKDNINYVVHHNKKDVIVPKDCVEFIHKPIETGRDILERQKFVSPGISTKEPPDWVFETTQKDLDRINKLYSLTAEFDEALTLLQDADALLFTDAPEQTEPPKKIREFLIKHGRKTHRPSA